MTKLPFWADQYLQNMQQYRAATYAELQAAGTLESIALQVQEAAAAFYQAKYDWMIEREFSTTQADIEAEGLTMREYILIPEDAPDRFIEEIP